MDWDDPSCPQINLTVVKLEATNPEKRKGTLFFQEGGPGIGSSNTLSLVANNSLSIFSDEMRENFDVVVQDPRGADGINYPVRCDPSLLNNNWNRTTLFPKTEKAWQDTIEVYEQLGKTCLNKTGPVFDHLDSKTQAKDLEAVRIALGEGPISFYGLSWGTQRLSQYAQLFPNNIRAMVIDAVLDHSWGLVRSSASEATGEALTLKHFLEWASTNKTSALYKQDAAKILFDLVKQADKHPIPVPGCPSTVCRPVRGEDIRGALTGALEGVGQWPLMAAGIAEAGNPDNRNVTSFVIPISTAETSLQFSEPAIACQDWNFTESWTDFQNRQQLMASLALSDPSDPAGFRKAFTLETQSFIRFLSMACPKWPARITNPQAPLHVERGTSGAPILITHALWDPSLGYDGAVEMTRKIEGSVLVTRRGEGHGNWFLPDSEITRAIDRYYIDLEVPEANTVFDS